MNFTLHLGDCLEVLKGLPSNSIDSLVTDPPAGIGFMNKAWDKDKGGRDAWIGWLEEVIREALRVLKPGAHALVWAFPRTSHWTAFACDKAGFDVRDCITHLFGSGFPKAGDMGKVLAKHRGGERIAKEWQGYGTALKPSSEHWWLLRKPLGEKTVAKNVLKHGTGAINIDASRISTNGVVVWKKNGSVRSRPGLLLDTLPKDGKSEGSPQGRFPANTILSHHPECELVGTKRSELAIDFKGREHPGFKVDGKETVADYRCHDDCAVAELDRQSGSASRFFYCSRASRKDKGEDNLHPTVKNTMLMNYLITMVTPPGGTVLDPFMGSGSTGVAAVRSGFGFVSIEMEAEYLAIANKRINATNKGLSL